MNSSRGASAPGHWGATVALPSVLAGLGLGGLGGNLLLLAVLVSELRRGRSPPPSNALLLNLCAADLLLALAGLPARLAASAGQAWLLGPGGSLCRAAHWLLHACLVAKSLSWAAVGQARCQHLQAPPKGPGWSCGRLAGVLASVWATALLLPLPVLLFARLDGADRRPACAFRPPAYAARFMEVFGKLYPLAAYLAPSAFTWACYGRALRLPRKNRLAQPSPRSRQATRLLLGLSLLFQATWLPEWVAWLWERHGLPGGGPPPALLASADLLLFLNASCSPVVFGAASEEFREGLRGLWTGLDCAGGGKEEGAGGAAAGETPPSREREAAPEKVLPDVEHFWKDRRNTTAGEESDPVPWEHQCGS